MFGAPNTHPARGNRVHDHYVQWEPSIRAYGALRAVLLPVPVAGVVSLAPAVDLSRLRDHVPPHAAHAGPLVAPALVRSAGALGRRRRHHVIDVVTTVVLAVLVAAAVAFVVLLLVMVRAARRLIDQADRHLELVEASRAAARPGAIAAYTPPDRVGSTTYRAGGYVSSGRPFGHSDWT